MFDRPETEVVSEDIDTGVYQMSVYPTDVEDVFSGFEEVLKYLDKVTKTRFSEPSTAAASLRVERVFSTLLPSSTTEQTDILQTTRNDVMNIIDGTSEVGDTRTIYVNIERPNRIDLVISDKPVNNFSYIPIPYTKEFATENDIETDLERVRQKCYKPLSQDTPIPGSSFTISFTKMDEDRLGVFVSSSNGYIPSSWWGKRLYRWLLRKDFDE